ncbi:unnamed protein product [Pleuronectes platessa]|uniref:Uncharacterized protein n=1 Tax=Pleuronectes platessa TaxID=8262 RepID=A0A9N7USU2_PLEPL|nr:unnamed protein product [Pleuronectes platessa]
MLLLYLHLVTIIIIIIIIIITTTGLPRSAALTPLQQQAVVHTDPRLSSSPAPRCCQNQLRPEIVYAPVKSAHSAAGGDCDTVGGVRAHAQGGEPSSHMSALCQRPLTPSITHNL